MKAKIILHCYLRDGEKKWWADVKPEIYEQALMFFRYNTQILTKEKAEEEARAFCKWKCLEVGKVEVEK